MLIYDLHSDINMILNTDISSDTDYDIWSNTEIWFTHVDVIYCKHTSTSFLILTSDLTVIFDLLM